MTVPGTVLTSALGSGPVDQRRGCAAHLMAVVDHMVQHLVSSMSSDGGEPPSDVSGVSVSHDLTTDSVQLVVSAGNYRVDQRFAPHDVNWDLVSVDQLRSYASHCYSEAVGTVRGQGRMVGAHTTRWPQPALSYRDVAGERAERLLLENLTEEQAAQYRSDKSFIVVGNHTGHKYLIGYGTSMNVWELDDQEAVCSLCFVPDGLHNAGDVMLAQKVALENFECGALQVANRFNDNRRFARRAATVFDSATWTGR